MATSMYPFPSGPKVDDEPFARRRDDWENQERGGVGVETFARPPQPIAKRDSDWWRDAEKKYVSMSLPIYALRHAHRTGIGKFTDLGRIYREMLSRQGIDTVVLLPPFQSTYISPYSPVSVYALNELYVDWTLVPEVDDGPLMKLTRTAQDPRWVHYDEEFPRAARLRLAAYREFAKSASPFRRRRFADFCSNQERNRNWLAEYAWFMAERENLSDQDARREAAESHMFAQWNAYNQFKCALDEIHAAGGHLAVDIPLFRAVQGVDVNRHPEYFRPGHPGAGGQIWGDQTLWNWDKLRCENSKFLVDPMEHWLDFGCDAIRVDAAANAFRREGQSGGGDEDGESFMRDLGQVFRERGALALVEVLCAPEVTASIENNGMLALYRDWQVYSTHDFVNVDLSQDPRNLIDEVRYLLRDTADKRGHKGALFVNVSFLDVEGDPCKLKRVEVRDGQTISVWDTQMSLPQDPDYTSRARWDRGAAMARVVQEETGRPIFVASPRGPSLASNYQQRQTEARNGIAFHQVGDAFHVNCYGTLAPGWHGFEAALASIPDQLIAPHLLQHDVQRYIDYVLGLVPASELLRDWVASTLPEVRTPEALRGWARQFTRRLMRHTPNEAATAAAE